MTIFKGRESAKSKAPAKAPKLAKAKAATKPTKSGAKNPEDAKLQKMAKDHLWMHFARQSVLEKSGVPIITKGEGHHLFDIHGKKFIDGLSGLFVVIAGHGRKRLAEAAA